MLVTAPLLFIFAPWCCKLVKEWLRLTHLLVVHIGPVAKIQSFLGLFKRIDASPSTMHIVSGIDEVIIIKV
jgi:hypothetical protein